MRAALLLEMLLRLNAPSLLVAMAPALLGVSLATTSCTPSAPPPAPPVSAASVAPDQRRTLLDDARALSVLPRSTEGIVVIRSLRWLTNSVGWDRVGPRLLLAMGIEEAPTLAGLDLSTSKGWTAAGLDLDAPVVFALLDARTETFAWIVGVRDRSRLLEMVDQAGRSLERSWTRTERGEATLVRDDHDERFGVALHDGLAAVVVGGGAFRALEGMVVETPAGSLRASPGLSDSMPALSPEADVVAWADLAGLVSDASSGRAGPRHPLLGALGVGIVGARVAGRDILISGSIELEEGSLPRRLFSTNPPKEGMLGALARSPIGVAAHLAPDALPELMAALWMFSARPEAAEAATEEALGADVQAEVLPRLDGRLALFVRSMPPASSPTGAARWAGQAWWVARDRASSDALSKLLSRAPAFSDVDGDGLVVSQAGEDFSVATKPGDKAPPWATNSGGSDELDGRAKEFFGARTAAPLCAIADLATLGYLDAPYHYASLDDPEPKLPARVGAPGASGLTEKRQELRAVEIEALAEWRRAEELDMKYVLSSLAELGRFAVCVSPSARGARFEGELMMRAADPAALFERWLSLRDGQSEAMDETLRRIEALEAKRWQLGEALRQLESAEP